MKALATLSATWPSAAPSSKRARALLQQQAPRFLGEMGGEILVGHEPLMRESGRVNQG